MEPVALARAAHHQHVPLARHEHDVGRIGSGRDTFHDLCQRRTTTDHERPTLTEHHDGNQGVVEPAHFTITVQALKVVAVAIQDRRNPFE